MLDSFQNNVIIINYIGDTRYSKSDKITTHDGISMDCKTCGKDLIDILIKSCVLTADVICINEGQFFDNLVEFCNIYASLGKEIYVCGLDGDYLKRPFGEILNLCVKLLKFWNFFLSMGQLF